MSKRIEKEENLKIAKREYQEVVKSIDTNNFTAADFNRLLKATKNLKNAQDAYNKSNKVSEIVDKARPVAKKAAMPAAILAGVTTLGTLVGCTKQELNKQESSEPETTKTVIESVDKKVDTTEIDSTIVDVTDFINDALSKGILDIDLEEYLKEHSENGLKDYLAKNFLGYYLMANQGDLSAETFKMLNQNGDLNGEALINNVFEVEEKLQEQAPGASLKNKLEPNMLFLNSDAAKLVDKMLTIISKMHDAIVAGNSEGISDKQKAAYREEYESLIKQANAMKNDMLSQDGEFEFVDNPIALDTVLQLIDIADSLSNGRIVGDVEADILNQAITKCVNGSFVSNLDTSSLEIIANRLNVQIVDGMSREQILDLITKSMIPTDNIKSLRSKLRSFALAAMKERIHVSLGSEVNSKYAEYNVDDANVIKEIKKGIDLTKFVKPEYGKYEFENWNPWGPNAYAEGGMVYGSTGGQVVTKSQKTTTSVTSKMVTPDQVPSSAKEAPTTSSKKADGSAVGTEEIKAANDILNKKDSQGKTPNDYAFEAGAAGKEKPQSTGNKTADDIIDQTYQINKDKHDSTPEIDSSYTEDVNGEEEVLDVVTLNSVLAEVGEHEYNEAIANLLDDDDYEEDFDMTIGGMSK